MDSTTSIKLLDERTIFMFAFRICFIWRDLVILFQQNVTSAEFEKFEAQTFARKAKISGVAADGNRREKNYIRSRHLVKVLVTKPKPGF